MTTSETISNLTSALIKFQHEITKIEKSAQNPFFKSKYAPLPEILSAIKEPLFNNKLGFVQFPCNEGGLTTRLFHESGEFMQETYFMHPVKQDPQGWGSVITYQRRYALGAILGLNIDDDDDGNKASTPAPAKPELNQTQFNAMLKAIESDKVKEVQERMKAYTIKPDWKNKLDNVIEAKTKLIGE